MNLYIELKFESKTVCNHMDDLVAFLNYFMHFREDRDERHVIESGGGTGVMLMIKTIRKACNKDSSRNRSWKTVEVLGDCVYFVVRAH